MDRSLDCAGSDIALSLANLHQRICEFCPAIERVAVALYDVETDVLHTYINSTLGTESPIHNYQVRLSSVPSLMALAKSGNDRCIDDLSSLRDSKSLHTQAILNAGFKSSYTIPLSNEGQLMGFVFFDSSEKAYFSPPLQSYLSLFGQLIFDYIKYDFSAIRTLKGVLRTATLFGRYRDEETAEHLKRMAYYSKAIAERTANHFKLSDSVVEFIYQFAPLHDIGKIAIQDKILFNPERLNEVEYAVMKEHVNYGADMVEMMIKEFGLGDVHNISILKNIVRHHHERYDGQGYPHGLCGESIPIESRIVSVADVFDALTSQRPYKKAWSLSKTLSYFEQETGKQFDPYIVAVMPDCLEAFTEIKQRVSAGELC